MYVSECDWPWMLVVFARLDLPSFVRVPWGTHRPHDITRNREFHKAFDILGQSVILLGSRIEVYWVKAAFHIFGTLQDLLINLRTVR